MKPGTAMDLLNAAERVLESLHDDHQACPICDQEIGHAISCSAYDLEDAVAKARKEWT